MGGLLQQQRRIAAGAELFDEHRVSALPNLRQNGDRQHQDRDNQQNRTDRPLDERHGIAARYDESLAQALLHHPAEHEAEREGRRS